MCLRNGLWLTKEVLWGFAWLMGLWGTPAAQLWEPQQDTLGGHMALTSTFFIPAQGSEPRRGGRLAGPVPGEGLALHSSRREVVTRVAPTPVRGVSSGNPGATRKGGWMLVSPNPLRPSTHSMNVKDECLS